MKFLIVNFLSQCCEYAVVKTLDDAIERHPDGVVLHIDVIPGSSELVVPAGFNAWRGSIEVRLTERADKGKANRQLLQEISRAFGLTQGDVEIMSGHRSQRKVVLMRGIDAESVLAALRRSIR
ncbi:MAG: YggU family protein [Methanothrix sp.]|nr:YggU family protein [Methanothrix sp.]